MKDKSNRILAFFIVALLLIVGLILQLVLAKHKIVAGVIVVRIQSESLFVLFDGLAEHSPSLQDSAQIVEGLRLAQGILLHFGGLFEELDGRGVLSLCQECITQVVEGLRVFLVLL